MKSVYSFSVSLRLCVNFEFTTWNFSNTNYKRHLRWRYHVLSTLYRVPNDLRYRSMSLKGTIFLLVRVGRAWGGPLEKVEIPEGSRVLYKGSLSETFKKEEQKRWTFTGSRDLYRRVAPRFWGPETTWTRWECERKCERVGPGRWWWWRVR